MTNSADIDSLVVANYMPGTNYPDGLRAGNFQSQGLTVGRGIGIGTTIPYSFSTSRLFEFSDRIILSGPGYLPLSTITNMDTLTMGDQKLNFDVPRTFLLNGDSSFTATVSGYEFYDRKLVTILPSVAVGPNYVSTVFRPYKSIASIYIEALSYPIEFEIKSTAGFDVPFTNNGNPSALFGAFDAIGPLLATPPAATLPYLAQWAWDNNGKIPSPDPNTPLTATSGLLRPVYAVNERTSDDIQFPMTIWMIVSEMGWNYDLQPIVSAGEPYPGSNLEKVIGQTPYSTGWIDWQG